MMLSAESDALGTVIVKDATAGLKAIFEAPTEPPRGASMPLDDLHRDDETALSLRLLKNGYYDTFTKQKLGALLDDVLSGGVEVMEFHAEEDRNDLGNGMVVVGGAEMDDVGDLIIGPDVVLGTPLQVAAAAEDMYPNTIDSVDALSEIVVIASGTEQQQFNSEPQQQAAVTSTKPAMRTIRQMNNGSFSLALSRMGGQSKMRYNETEKCWEGENDDDRLQIDDVTEPDFDMDRADIEQEVNDNFASRSQQSQPQAVPQSQNRSQSSSQQLPSLPLSRPQSRQSLQQQQQPVLQQQPLPLLQSKSQPQSQPPPHQPVNPMQLHAQPPSQKPAVSPRSTQSLSQKQSQQSYENRMLFSELDQDEDGDDDDLAAASFNLSVVDNALKSLADIEVPENIKTRTDPRPFVHAPLRNERVTLGEIKVPDNIANISPDPTPFVHAPLRDERANSGLVTSLASLGIQRQELTHVCQVSFEGAQLTSTDGFESLLPCLQLLNLSRNNVSSLNGLPKSVTALILKHNRITNLSGVHHLINLKTLDLSYNGFPDLSSVQAMSSLQELNVSYNCIRSPMFHHSAPIEFAGTLRSLEISSNNLESLNDVTELHALEKLDVSSCQLSSAKGLESLKKLRILNADFNWIKAVPAMQSLMTLSARSNEIEIFAFSGFPRLLDVNLSGNPLQRLGGASAVAVVRVDAPLIRPISLNVSSFSELQHISLHGAGIRTLALFQANRTLQVLDVTDNSVSCIDPDFAAAAQNLSSLIIARNRLSSKAALQSLPMFKSLTSIDLSENRLQSAFDTIAVLKHTKSLSTINLRQNPFTAAFYPLRSVEDNEDLESWRSREKHYRRSLSDKEFVLRATYRNCLIQSLPHLNTLDDVPVSARDRAKAARFLDRLRSRGGGGGGGGGGGCRTSV